MPLHYPYYVPAVPKSPGCYSNAHSDRIDEFPEEIEELVDPRKLKNQPQDDRWRRELDHDVESVFWLLLYWAMVAQPEGLPGEYIDSSSWSSMLGNSGDRIRLVSGLSSGPPPQNLVHSVYEPVWPLISSLAALLVVDKHWLPESGARKRPDYTCEAFQRLILQFIDSKRSENFMTCRVGDSLRQVQGVAQYQVLLTTPSRQMDGLERETQAKRRRLDRTVVGCICAMFEFLSFSLLCSQDEDENESSRMIQ